MVPPAISVIYCHLRWRDGSLWHWPLTHPTFFSEWRIMLIVTPLSAARICLGDRDRRTKDLQTFDRQLHRDLSPPRGRIPPCSSSRSQELTVGDFLTSSSLRPLFHFTCHNQNRRYMWPREPLLHSLSFWEHGPFDSAGLHCRADWILKSVYFTAHQADKFQIQIRIHSFPLIHFTWLWFVLVLSCFYAAIKHKKKKKKREPCVLHSWGHKKKKPGSSTAPLWQKSGCTKQKSDNNNCSILFCQIIPVRY